MKRNRFTHQLHLVNVRCKRMSSDLLAFLPGLNRLLQDPEGSCRYRAVDSDEARLSVTVYGVNPYIRCPCSQNFLRCTSMGAVIVTLPETKLLATVGVIP